MWAVSYRNLYAVHLACKIFIKVNKSMRHTELLNSLTKNFDT